MLQIKVTPEGVHAVLSLHWEENKEPPNAVFLWQTPEGAHVSKDGRMLTVDTTRFAQPCEVVACAVVDNRIHATARQTIHPAVLTKAQPTPSPENPSGPDGGKTGGQAPPPPPSQSGQTGPQRDPNGVVRVGLQRSMVPQTDDEVLWVLIRHSTNNLGFANYSAFMDAVLCGESKELKAEAREKLATASRIQLPFPGVEPYRQLKAITEVFLQVFCSVRPKRAVAAGCGDLANLPESIFAGLPLEPLVISAEDSTRFNHNLPASNLSHTEVFWKAYTQTHRDYKAMPYLQIVSAKLRDVGVTSSTDVRLFDCMKILQDKLLYPCFVELIWSYWHEEGMLAQTMLKLTDRFQNRRSVSGRDPLANLEIDPLRSLNNFLWGYIQDEQHRLSVRRRAHEYDHHYGMTLHGKAVGELSTADRRSKFIESFHNLLHECTMFYRQDDDTTVIADGFRVLNAIKEAHYILAQGAHNQFGDLPVTSRQEMLIEQWLLGRPEMREFLGGRVMVPYPEAWMDRVDSMKTLQGWTDVSIVHFRDLGTFGEQILLGVRYGGWSVINDPNRAANWARYWRAEIQAYVHAYRAVTGIDIAADVTAPQELAQRYLPPSVHLRNRLMESARR